MARGAYRQDLAMILPLLRGGMPAETGLTMFMGARDERDARQEARDQTVAQVMSQVAGMMGQEGTSPAMMDDMAETLLHAGGINQGGRRWNQAMAGLAPVFTQQAELTQQALIDSPEDLDAVAQTVAEMKGQLGEGENRSDIRQRLHLQYETMAQTLGVPYTPEERDAVNRIVDATYGGPSSYFGNPNDPAADPIDPNQEANPTDITADPNDRWYENSLVKMLTFGGSEKIGDAQNTGDIFEGIGQSALGLGSLVAGPLGIAGRAAQGAGMLGKAAGAAMRIPGMGAAARGSQAVMNTPAFGALGKATGVGGGGLNMLKSPVGGALAGNYAANAMTEGDPGLMGPVSAAGGAFAGQALAGGLNALRGGGQAAAAGGGGAYSRGVQAAGSNMPGMADEAAAYSGGRALPPGPVPGQLALPPGPPPAPGPVSAVPGGGGYVSQVDDIAAAPSFTSTISQPGVTGMDDLAQVAGGGGAMAGQPGFTQMLAQRLGLPPTSTWDDVVAEITRRQSASRYPPGL